MPDVDLTTFDAGLLEESWSVELGDYIIALDVSPDKSKIAAVTVEGLIFLIQNDGSSVQLARIGRHQGGANSVSWRCDGEEFATAGHDGLVIVWDGCSGSELSALEAGDSWVSRVAYSPRRRVLATAAGKHLKLWNEQRELVYESSDHASTIADLGWNPDGSAVAVAAYYGVTLHVPGRQKQPRKYRWKGSSLVLAWSPDGKYIATGEQDATVHFWHVKSGEDAQMHGFPSKVLELAWDTNGLSLATGGGPSVCVWDCSGAGPEDRAPLQLKMHPGKLTQLDFQPDGRLLASTDAEFLFLWDPSRHTKIIGATDLSSPVSQLRWFESDKLVIGQQDGRLACMRLKPATGNASSRHFVSD